MRIVRLSLGTAYIALGAAATAAAVARLMDRDFGIGNFPADVVAGLGAGLIVVGVVWLVPSLPMSNVIRAIGAITGVVLGAFGIWGTSIVWSDFCSTRPAPASTGSLGSSIPAGVECWDVVPSLLIGGWMIAVGGLSLAALLLDFRFAGRIDGDPALD
jgi:hypothetical protein